MPSFLSIPTANIPLLVPGRPQYLFGKYSATISPTLAYISGASLTGNVATLNLALTAGNVPNTNQLITVQQCSDTNFNIVQAAVTAVTGFDTGDNSIGTVSYAVTHADILQEAATGNATMPVAVIAEALTATGPSLQVALPYNDPRIDQSRTIVAQVSIAGPSACTVDLEASDDDVSYYFIATAATVAGSTQTLGFANVTAQSAAFFRFNVTALSGSGTIIAQISA